MRTETPRTLDAALERAAAHPRAGLRFLDRRERADWRSWESVREAALEVCGGLQALGVRRGQRIGLVFPTGPDFFAAYFGALAAGAVPAPLYPPRRLGSGGEYVARTGAMLRTVEASLVLVARGCRKAAEETATTAGVPGGAVALEELPGRAASPVGCCPGDLALVQFSSGTTAEPKPVALSHRAVLAQVGALNACWPGERHSGVSWLPLYHDMGLIGCAFTALERPGILTLLPPELFAARPGAWLRAISRYRATISPAPNFGYAYCVSRIRAEELEELDLSSWEVALSGAEAVVPATLREFARRFAPAGFRERAFTPVYGLAEAALAVTFSPVDESPVSRRFDRRALATEGVARPRPEGLELVSLGRPLPGFGLEIRDGEGRTLSSGRVGRIWVRGPSLMDGYLGEPERTRRRLRDGWLDTGDRGFLHQRNLYVTGRDRDLIILRGENYSPEEMERAVAAVPGVRVGGVVAVGHRPAGAAGEELLIFAERRRGWEGDDGGLAAACGGAVLAAVGVEPRRVELLAPGWLPRTSSGKVRRGETLRRFLAGELRPLRANTHAG